jgi:hypothetical protein
MHKGWQTNGNAFSGLNKMNYNSQWYDRFFCEKSWLMYTLNAVSMTQNFLENTGCTWMMTSMGDLRKLGTDLEKQTLDYEKVIFSEGKNDEFPAWQRFPELRFYEDEIWNRYRDKWTPPINPYTVDRHDLYWYYQAEHDKEPWYDGHPTPPQYQFWLNETLRPALHLTGIPTAQQDVVDKCVEIKNLPIGMNALKLEHYLMRPDRPKEDNLFPELHDWPNPKRGL